MLDRAAQRLPVEVHQAVGVQGCSIDGVEGWILLGTVSCECRCAFRERSVTCGKRDPNEVRLIEDVKREQRQKRLLRRQLALQLSHDLQAGSRVA